MADKYVDFSAANNGDGTTAAQAGGAGATGAFNTLVGVTPVIGDKIWFRRAGTMTIVATLTISIGNVKYIGWPLADDIDFLTRPASGISNNWDNDSKAVLPKFTVATAFSYSITTGLLQSFRRINFDRTANATTLVAPSVACEFTNCTFSTAALASAVLLPSHATGTTTVSNCTFTLAGASTGLTYASAGHMVVKDCTFTKSAQAVAGFMIQVNGNPTGGFICKRCTFKTLTATSTAVTCIGVIGASATIAPVFIDCILDNSTSNAAGEYAWVSTSRAITRNCSVKGTGVKITPSLQTLPMHFSRIEQTYVQATGALQLLAGSATQHITIDTLIAKEGNTNDITTVEGALVQINSAQFKSAAPITGITDPGVYCSSYLGVLGDFKHYGRNGTVVSNRAVTRVGGENFSLQFNLTGTALNSRAPLCISPPGMETIYANLVAGTNTVTVYGGYRAYASVPTKEDVWFDIEYLDQSTGARKATTSSRVYSISGNYTLTSDTSVWKGTTLTSFSLSVTITVGQACIAPIHLYFCKSDANGNTYLDVKPVVT